MPSERIGSAFELGGDHRHATVQIRVSSDWPQLFCENVTYSFLYPQPAPLERPYTRRRARRVSVSPKGSVERQGARSGALGVSAQQALGDIMVGTRPVCNMAWA